MDPSERSWRGIQSKFLQTSALQAREPVSDADSFVKKETNWFKFDGSPNAAVVDEVLLWFKKLIHNDEVMLDVAQLDAKFLAEIVAATGATVESLEQIIAKEEFYSKKLTNIGILRFPDADRPYFTVSALDLDAWRRSMRIGPLQDDSNGIKGEYFTRVFEPRKTMLDTLTPEKKKAAAEQAEKLLLEHLGLVKQKEAEQVAQVDALLTA